MALSVILNGHSRDFADLAPGSTLTNLIASLDLKSDRIAVEHNGEIVPRSTWSTSQLSDNDRVEVVHFVGGGA
jgi:sulfur carrier protein